MRDPTDRDGTNFASVAEMTPRPDPPDMAHLQEEAHGVGFDYEPGSPHLSHPGLRAQILGTIRALVQAQFTLKGQCRVLEVGAGHGAFTDHVLAMGAEVTVTEMSRPSLDLLHCRYAHNKNVVLLHDLDGDAVATGLDQFDLVLCVSVLHHIPDYLSFVSVQASRLAPGGTFASFQDPTWYPRRSAASVKLDRAMYLSWRIGQGNLARGITTQLRRFRGTLDVSQPSDMVEYHVVRNGVDEDALVQQLSPDFADVRVWRYFSTQGRIMQRIGDRVCRPQTFAIIATGRSTFAASP